MARKRTIPRLAAGEMELLQVLWQEDGVTLSEAHRALRRKIGYTTVQTRLNRLVGKGFAQRTTDRPAKYRAAVAPEEVSAGHLDLLLERVSGGSVVPLVAHLVRDRDLSRGEVEQLRRLVDEAEKNVRN
jgi:predicted transcriptional regulator